MEPEESEDTANVPLLEHLESSLHPHNLFSQVHFNIIFPFMPGGRPGLCSQQGSISVFVTTYRPAVGGPPSLVSSGYRLLSSGAKVAGA